MSTEDALHPRSRLVRSRLAEAGIATEIHVLPESTHTAKAAAQALGCPVGAIASSLLFLAGDEPLLVMTSGAHRADPGLLAGEAGADDVRMASAKTVKELTGQPIGGVAPVGHPHRLRTLVDASLEQYDEIWSAAGMPNTVMPLTFEQLVAVTDGRVATVAPD